MRWTIRRAVHEDAEPLSAFGHRVNAATFAAGNDPQQLALYLATAYTPDAQAAELADAAITTLLACDDSGAIAGFAQLRTGVPHESVPDPLAIELWRFYVGPEWHGRGLAAVLMEAVLAEARHVAPDAAYVWLGVWEHNARAQAFYRKCAFTPVGTHAFMFGTESQTDQVWMRPLPGPGTAR